jgi:hypothetical protein
MPDRIYVTYKPTIAPESYHTAVHYERTDAAGNIIEHRVLEAAFSNQLSYPEKILGAIEERFRDDDGPSRFGNIKATVRGALAEDNTYPYEEIAQGQDLSTNFAKMQLYGTGVTSGGFAYRGEHQNSNTFVSGALEAGELRPATGVAHDPAGPAGELLEFFAPGLNEPLKAPIGQTSSYEPVTGVQYGSATNPDGSTTYTGEGGSSYNGTIAKVSLHTTSENVVDHIVTDGRDGTETSETRDVRNHETWSAQTIRLDSQTRAEAIETLNDDGTSKLQEYDPNNTHPYSELDLSEDASGKVTAIQFKLDRDDGTRSTAGGAAVDLSAIGQVFGSALGRILAPDNQFGHLLGGTVGGLMGQKLLQNFTASLSFDASTGVNADFATISGLDVASAAAGSVASFLIAELGNKLGLRGYDAALFDNGAGALSGSLLNTVIAKGGLQALAQEATWTAAFATAEGAVGGTLGGLAAQSLIHAESKEGAVAGQLLGAAGSALGISFVALNAITGLLNFVIPGVGSFFGTMLGIMLGDAIAGDPGAPKAFHDVEILGTDYHFTNRLVGTDDHGNAAISKQMGDAVVGIVNNFLDSIHGAGISYPGKIMIGYSDGGGPYDYVAGWFPHGTEPAPRFTDPNDAVQEAVRELLMQTLVIGGDLLQKRAQHNSSRRHPSRGRKTMARRCIRAVGNSWAENVGLDGDHRRIA